MVILSFGCSKSDEGVDTPSAVEVRVETSGAETLSSEKGLGLMLKVSPADTDFTYANGSYNVKLFYRTK